MKIWDNSIMKKLHLSLSVSGMVLFAAFFCRAGDRYSADVVIYGSSPAAITAGIEAKKLGKSVIVVSPEKRIGGLTTGGLGQTDIGNKSAFGGLALKFYADVAKYYQDPAHWKYEKRSQYKPDGQCANTNGELTMWTFEPSAALAILEEWVKSNQLVIHRGELLDRGKGGVEKTSGGKIAKMHTLSGKTYEGKIFIDATYEGDLMASAGVSYTVGREANSVYGETISGIQRAKAHGHQLYKGVSAYRIAGDKTSGLLPGIEEDVPDIDGTGDTRVQAYCFRMCLTDVKENQIPFKKPEGYNELDYELLLRNLEAIPAEKLASKDPWSFMPWINSMQPNRKTDTNNRTGVSTDFIGANYGWPEGSYEERAKIFDAHLKYQKGLMWTLANHPRVPEPIRKIVSRWGTCKDEFADGPGDGWQSQLYVREARRLVGEYVATEHDVLRKRLPARPVAMAAYGMDSHNVRRYVDKNGFVRNEGNIEDWRAGGKPYSLDYGIIVPKRGEAANLLVPVCVSASHMAFGSIRMEPVFFSLGQVAGTAASIAIDAGCSVQDVDYGILKKQLLADGQIIESQKQQVSKKGR